MLQNLLIFSLCVVAAQSTGEFTILNTPKSLSFKGNQPIQSSDVGEVVFASLGNAIKGDSDWSGMNIVDAFNLPKRVVAVSLYGADHSKVSGDGKTYPLQGNTVEQSLNGVTAQFEADNEAVCAISFKQFEEGALSFRNSIGDVKVSSVVNTKYLNGDLHTADKQFLDSIAFVNAVADNLVNMEKPCDFLYISLFIDAVAKAHGENSDAVNEALDLFYAAVKHLNKETQKSDNNALIVVAVNKADDKSRSKRDAASTDDKNLYNLAEYYNEDYPVIFNIILWFMVVFGLALLAICYAIGSMDPGRDSIIYRMTSTRMKKDN